MQKSGAKDESSRSGTLTFNGTHASERGAAARKVEWGPALREFENFVGSRFTANSLEFDTQDTGPAYIRMRLTLARGPLDPLLSQPYSISRRAGPLKA